MSPTPVGRVRSARSAARLFLVSAALTAVISTAPAAAQPAPLRTLPAYVEQGMEAWKIPGLAIAVVKGGETAWARGFGVRDIRTGEPVDEHTLFAIGSSSKAFTAAAVGMLVQEGLVAFDDPATKYLPSLRTSDPWVTRELTVRDLLTHRSGLDRGDQIWYAMDVDREEVLERVRHQPPTTSFRSAFGYNNNMFLAAGQIVESVTGLTWDAFVDRRIFAPLGMTRSVTSTLPLARMENVAQPHARIDGEVRAIPWRNIDNIAPAGAINSSVAEMASWLKLQLGHGELGGQRLLDEAVLEEMHTPQTIIPLRGPWADMAPAAHFLSYGMGWFLHDYRARKVIQHGGNIDGMHALVALMPEEELGIVILTNLPNGLTTALIHRTFDLYLGGADRDWSAELLERTEAQQARAEAARKQREESRVKGTTPSLPLERYAGTYRHPMYGELQVSHGDSGLVARRSGSYVGDLEHWHYDTFTIDWRDDTMGETLLTFRLDVRGRVASAEPQGMAPFTRVADTAANGGGR
jgi:CubicO group peptidase (beta-lactamase class C family)